MIQEIELLHNNFYSEEHRHNCEVRYCIKLPLQERRKYLSLVMEKRGLQERERLEASLYKLWEKNRGQNR